MRRPVTWLLASLLLWSCAVAGLIAFGTAEAPPTLGAVTNPFASIDTRDLPPLERYRARDGAELSFRRYPGGNRQATVLIHGSAGSSIDMHPLARALQADGATVFVPDLRGHGANSPRGDIAYPGQLEDDLSDLLDRMQAPAPAAAWNLVGFSSGGGFALRIAASDALGKRFSRCILIAPYLKYNAPSVRSGESLAHEDAKHTSATLSDWAAPFTGRIIGLSILDSLGLHVFDGLPVIAFAVPAGESSVTHTYSWRLLRDFGAHSDYVADIRALRCPTRVYVGADDQLLYPDKLAGEFQLQRADIPVVVVPGAGHSDMITRPDAIGVIAGDFPR
jgi:non-heme chloroperoxidase